MTTRTSKMRTMMTLSIAAACAMAAYSAQKGYATTTQDSILSVGIAVACGFFVFVFCDFLVVFLPRMEDKGRWSSAGLSVLVMGLMFYFSTQWTVVSVGGKTAMNTHIQTTIEQADEAALTIYRQLTTEKNMAPQLRSLSQQYADLATRESVGAFSGLIGEGDVVATLRSTSRLFENAARTIEDVAADGDELYGEYQGYSDFGRRIMSELQGTEVTDGDVVRQLLLQFGSTLSEINRVLTRMRGTSAVEFVRAMSSNLGDLALTPQSASSQAQRDAIERLTPAVEAAQRVVLQITKGDDDLSLDAEDQTFAMMEPAEAIWVYSDRIRFAWGAAIALDLIPFIFAFCSLLIASEVRREEEEEEEREEEEREASRPTRRIAVEA